LFLGDDMKQALIASVAAIVLGTGSAFAADMTMPLKAPPEPPPSYTWTGCYVDAGAGYGLWNQDQHQINPAGVAVTPWTTDGGRGWLGRFGGGCDYQVGSSWVIGALADYDVQDLKGTISPLGITGAGIPAFGDEKETGAWYVGGRLGYLITPGLLGYIDGGYTETHFDATTLLAASATPLPGPRGLPGHDYNGWFLGGGYEYALNFAWLPVHGLFWRTEYRYAEYDSTSLPITDLVTGATAGSVTSKPYVQTITSSLVWRFNWVH
jgi:outer membrane immunogenic protein